ncbi:hypothetical protein DI43_18895 [Geobacillus sp. CAMR12739]|nr:hypothetical protein DI43_18895 [Geobacillus sp. CAMR12739]
MYGPRQSVKNEGGVVAAFIRKQLAKEPPVIFGDDNYTRDFVFVKDVARANCLSLTKGDNETFNIGTNKKQRSTNWQRSFLSSSLRQSIAFTAPNDSGTSVIAD